jgi:L-rhamnose mutarotase
MRILTHKLKYYKDYKEKLIKAIDVLNKQNAKFYIDLEEKTYDEIITLINEESNSNIRIYLEKLNNKIFNNIYESIKEDNFFLSIYQIDLDEKQPPEIKNPNEFFLEPFPTNDEKLFNGPTYGAETYTYERSARLFLEYFDEINNQNK